MTDARAWINGEFLSFSDMAIPVWDLGVVAGASVTEMARTFAHQPFRLTNHIDRLLSSCQELGFEVPWSAARLQQIAETLVAENVQRISASDDLGIVMFVTAGANRTYLGDGDLPGPTVGVHTFRLPLELWYRSVVDGVRLHVPEIRQIDAISLPIHLKTRNRLHWWLADREAAAVEPGSKALLLDSADCFTETSTACFYAVIANRIVTPDHHVLHSMSCRMVEEAAAAAGLEFRRTRIPREQLAEFSEAFLTSTPVGIMPVQSINGSPLPVDPDGAFIRMLRNFWKQQTNIDPAQQIINAAEMVRSERRD
ncbi:MAG: aminotransferase class IV [Planctomycetaceae bacterium]